MSWDEPLAIAARLAASLGLPLWRSPDEHPHAPTVALVDEAQLATLPVDAVAAVVVGAGAATSGELAALRARVEARELTVALTAFATRPHAQDADIAEVPLVVATRNGDARVSELLAAGPHALMLDATVAPDSVGADDPPARVCVVSFEASGMTGGGIGTASSSLAETLARRGHDVTLLFTGWQETGGGEQNERWRTHYAERGVRLELLRPPGTNSVKSPYFPARSAYEVYCWLRREPSFDVVHLPDNMGHGAYAQQAKRCGLQFAQTTFVVGTHGPTRWAAEANRIALTREEFLVNDALERFSVAHADVLLGPSRYLHDYLRARGWRLPQRVHVQPYAAPTVVRSRQDDAPAAAAAVLPTEIVFFGRLETRKGVVTLCDALDVLADDDPPAVEVTFLGPIAAVLGQPADAYIAGRAHRWPWRWQIISDRDQQGVAEYLARPGVLAAMPSLVDNAPNTVSEAVALGIPFVAAATGGIGELIAAEQRDDHVFGAVHSGPVLPLPFSGVVPAIEARPLAELLRRRLAVPVAPAQAPVAAAAVDDAYDRWHRAVRRAQTAPAGDAADAALPSLAACIVFDGDEQLLAAQLDAFDTDDGELVVADVRETPGEPPRAASERGVAVVRPTAPGHAAEARTAAAAATRAELLAVVPPGDVPLPAFAATLRRAAAATGADVYGCAVHDELDGPCGDLLDAMPRAFVPLGAPALAGLAHPAFSAGPYAIRRSALERLGGFSPDARADEADHELLNRAAAAGLVLEVVPEPLAVKRRPDRWSTFREVWPHDVVEPPYDAEQWLRVERPFADRPELAGDLVGLRRGANAEALRLQRELLDQHRVYEDRVAEHRQWIDTLEADAALLRSELARLADERARLAHELSQGVVQRTARLLSRGIGRLAQRRRG